MDQQNNPEDLKARCEQLSADNARLDKALKETQQNFAAIAGELDVLTSARMDAESQRDVACKESEDLKRKIGKIFKTKTGREKAYALLEKNSASPRNPDGR